MLATAKPPNLRTFFPAAVFVGQGISPRRCDRTVSAASSSPRLRGANNPPCSKSGRPCFGTCRAEDVQGLSMTGDDSFE